MLHLRVAYALALIVALPLAGCGGGGQPHLLTVFAAASLHAAFDELGPRFTRAHPGAGVAFDFAGSQRLLAQLDLGARADLLAAASPREMETARRRGLLAGEPVIFARNRLTIVLPAGNPAAIAVPADLARPGARIALADAAVPVGAYSRAVLAKLALAPGTAPDFVARVLANVVSYEDDAKQVVAKVQLGEVDAALAYATDGRAAGLPTVEIPAPYNEEGTYLIALLAGAREDALAKDFVAYLLSEEGQAVLAAQGFLGAAESPGETESKAR